MSNVQKTSIKCSGCDLHKTSACNCLSGEGPNNAKILFVFDPPKELEEKYRRPVLGPWSDEFNGLLRKVGIRREDCYLTHIVKCRPAPVLIPGGYKPKYEEGKIKTYHIEACGTYLEDEIKRIKPTVIVTLGKNAASYFFGNKKLTEIRGRGVFESKYNAIIFPTYSPSVLLKTSKYQSVLFTDFKQIKLLTQGQENTMSPVNYVMARDIDTVRSLRDRIKEVELFAFDIETTSLDFRYGKLISISFSWKENTAVCVPLIVKNPEYKRDKNNFVKHSEDGFVCLTKDDKGNDIQLNYFDDEVSDSLPLWKAHEQIEIEAMIREILSSNIPKICHNGSFDVTWMWMHGFKVNNYAHDTILMHHLLDEEAEHGLDALSWVYTDRGGYKQSIKEFLQESDDTFLEIPLDVLMPYNASDADVTFRLFKIFKERLEKENLWKLYSEVTMPLQVALIDTQVEGVLIDKDYVKKLLEEYNIKIGGVKDKLEPYIKRLYGSLWKVIASSKENTYKKKKKDEEVDEKDIPGCFNIGSTRQLGDLFFNKLNLPIIKRGKSGPSTDDEVLTKLVKLHEIPALISEYRRLGKVKSTYFEGFLEMLDELSRIHAEYMLFGTATGRLSSSPNLQNIPRESLIKDMFIASPGNVLFAWDGSQMELRGAACLSGDPVMTNIFVTDGDIHMDIAKDIYPGQEIDKEKRVVAKKVNFGIAYQMSGIGMAMDLENEGIYLVTKDEALKTILSFGNTKLGMALKSQIAYNDTTGTYNIEALEKYRVEQAAKKGDAFIELWYNKFKKMREYAAACENSFWTKHYVENPFGRKRRFLKIPSEKSVVKALLRQAVNFPMQSYSSDVISTVTGKLHLPMKNIGAKLRLTVHDSLVYELPIESLGKAVALVKEVTSHGMPLFPHIPFKVDMEVGLKYGSLSKIKIDKDGSILQLDKEGNATKIATLSV